MRFCRRLAAFSLLLPAALVHAGRPLTVDDANVNAPGAGHVEAWYARLPGQIDAWTIAPAFSPAEGFEFSAAMRRDASTPLTSSTIQVKSLFTPTQERGCNAGALLGAVYAQGTGNTPYAVGLLSCNSKLGSTHFNLGASRNPGGPTLELWGIAHEHAFGAVTADIEVFGQRESKPTLQIGARTDIAKNVQLDGTLGRNNKETLTSIGLKFSF